MAEPRTSSSSTSPPRRSNSCLNITVLLIVPFLLSLILYQPNDFSPAHLPADYSYAVNIAVSEHDDRVIHVSERIGEGLLPGPEDLAYDEVHGFLYTGCSDGWIKRVKFAQDGGSEVEDWVNIGGRALGLVFDEDRNLIVADADHGLMKVMPDKKVELLTEEAEGLRFGITDGVDVAVDGIIYFTDASYKYSLDMHMLDFLEGRPHGRLLSFDPSTKETVVLARDLYFANGVSISPDQESLIFCETPLRRCKRYHIKGDKKGTIESFIENLPGFPDNIHSDGEGRYWIALSAGRTAQWDLLFKYPLLRKIVFILEKFVRVPSNLKNAGVLTVTLEGKPLAMYTDPGLALTTSGLKIGKHLYYGSLIEPYISRIDLTKSAANLN